MKGDFSTILLCKVDILLLNSDSDFFWKYYTGSILNVESATLKVSEGREKAVIDPDNTVCHENGGKMKRYTQIIRVFYVIGEPANETIGLVIFSSFHIKNKNNFFLQLIFFLQNQQE